MKKFYSFNFFALTLLVLTLNSNSFAQLSGTFTIGNGGNYATINSAVTALVSNGINGPVIFNIMTGAYNEVISIDTVKGATLLNTVTFQSQTGNASDVTITSSSSSSDFVIKLNRADFIKFQKITFNNTLVSSQRRIIELTRYSDNISFLNNVFVTSGFDYNVSSYMIYSSEHGNNLFFKRNSFIGNDGALNGTKEAIRLNNTSQSEGIEISNNFFNDLTHSITVNYTNDVSIEKNIINCGTGLDIQNSGIFLSNCSVIRILKNNIVSQFDCGPTPIGLWARSGTSMTLESSSNVLVANNFFNFRGCAAIRIIAGSTNVRFFFNTDAGGNERVPLNLVIDNSYEILLLNNIHVNTYPIANYSGVIYNVQSSTMSSNYNAFKFIADMGSYNGVEIEDLSEWRSVTGDDLNSKARNIFFVSSSNLHLAGASLTDDSLKGIPLAEVTDDYDGDPRNPQHPTIGADEPLAQNIAVDLSLLIEGFYNSSTDAQVPDVVNSRLRAVTSPYSIVDTAVTNINSEGSAALRFFNAPSGTYYIEINHRNSIETWSKAGGQFLTFGSTTQYDFSTSVSQAFGNNLKLKGTRYCIYSGDVNKDDVIDGTDTQLIDNAAFNFISGYINPDVDGNNFVDGNDVSIADNNAFNFVSVIRP